MENKEDLAMREEDVAAFFHTSKKTVDYWLTRKLLPVHKIGSANFFNREEIEDMIGGCSERKQKAVIIDLLQQIQEELKRKDFSTDNFPIPTTSDGPA